MNTSELDITFRNASRDDASYITKLAYSQMNRYLEKAYNGEFNWAKWESDVREVIYDQNHGNHLFYASKINQFTKVFIIEDSTTIIGFIWFSYYTSDIIWVDSIVLDPFFQSKGYVKKIFEHLFQTFKNEFQFLDLGVQEENKRARKFYERIGFYRIPDIASEYYLTIRLRKDL